MKLHAFKIFVMTFLIISFFAACSITKPFKPEPVKPTSVKQEGYLRIIEKVAVIIDIAAGQVNRKAANYLDEALSDMFFERGIQCEIVVDDYNVSGEDIGKIMDDFGPVHVLTVYRTDTGNFEVDLYDNQEDIKIWTVKIISDLNDIPVEVGDRIFTAIRDELEGKNLI